MYSTPIFSCITIMVLTLRYVLSLAYLSSNISLQMLQILAFYRIPAALLLIIFFFFKKLIISSACYLKDSQNFFMQALPLYTSCLFSMLLDDDIVKTEKPDRIYSPTFAVDEFSGLFLHP